MQDILASPELPAIFVSSYGRAETVVRGLDLGTADYGDERRGAYKQVRGLGGLVRRGKKGSALLFWFWQFETRKPARDRSSSEICRAPLFRGRKWI